MRYVAEFFSSEKSPEMFKKLSWLSYIPQTRKLLPVNVNRFVQIPLLIEVGKVVKGQPAYISRLAAFVVYLPKQALEKLSRFCLVSGTPDDVAAFAAIISNRNAREPTSIFVLSDVTLSMIWHRSFLLLGMTRWLTRWGDFDVLLTVSLA
jgi:hypothetical protein